MKKIASLTVLVLFLISIMSVAIAQDTTDAAKQTNVKIAEKAQVRETPCICTTEYNPVCGSDGKTYSNRCQAKCAGIAEYKEGKCPIDKKSQTPSTTDARKLTVRERFEERRIANTEKLTNLDPEKIRRLEALSNVNLEKIAGLNKPEINKIATLSRARQKELAGLNNKAEIEKALAKIKVRTVNKAEDLKLRVLAKEKIALAKNKFAAAKEKYENAREKYLDAKQKYLAAKESGDEEAALEQAKEVLLKSAESIIGHLEKIKSKIQENENIGEEKAADLVARIDNQISEIGAIKEKIEAAQTKEEIRAAAKELNNKWKEYKQKIRAFAERVVTARVQGVINQAEILEKKLDIALAKLEEKGIEVDVDAEVEAFSTLIADAKETFQKAQDKLEQAQQETNKDSVKALVDEAKSLIENSRESLKEAHGKLKEIAAKVREAGQELKIDETAAVEVENTGEQNEKESEVKEIETKEDDVTTEEETEESNEVEEEKYCVTDSDCECGINIATGDCFYGNKAYIDADRACPDFCSGITGQLTIKCVDNECKQV